MNDNGYRYFLGISYDGYLDRTDEPWILYATRTREEMDEYTRNFTSDEEIRRIYDQRIGECALVDRKKIEKNETKYNNFHGRICTFYFDKNNKIHFFKVAYKNRKIVRDYHELKTVNERMEFFRTIFDLAIKRMAKEELKHDLYRNEKMAVIISTFEKIGYRFSENEKYYLAIYFNKSNDKSKNDIFNLIKINIINEAKREEELKKEEHELEDECDVKDTKYEVYDSNDTFFNEIFNRAIRENNFELLFKYFTVDEIDQKSNYFKVLKEKDGMRLCIK